MNIFYLAKDAKVCAAYHNDKHVVKMILESAQLLSTAHHIIDGEPSIDCYKATHKNHPSAIWARESGRNYEWLWCLTKNLCKEYTRRYNKVHKVETSRLLDSLANRPYELNLGEFTDPPQCMPDEYKVEGDSVQAYRNYYIGAKAGFSKWYKKEDMKPSWWTEAA